MRSTTSRSTTLPPASRCRANCAARHPARRNLSQSARQPDAVGGNVGRESAAVVVIECVELWIVVGADLSAPRRDGRRRTRDRSTSQHSGVEGAVRSERRGYVRASTWRDRSWPSRCSDEVRTTSGVARRWAPMISKIRLRGATGDRRALAISISGRLDRSRAMPHHTEGRGIERRGHASTLRPGVTRRSVTTCSSRSSRFSLRRRWCSSC